MLFATIVTVFFTKMPRCIVTGFAQTGLAKFKFDDFVFKGCTMCTNILRPFLFAHCTAIRRRPPIRLIARLFLESPVFVHRTTLFWRQFNLVHKSIKVSPTDSHPYEVSTTCLRFRISLGGFAMIKFCGAVVFLINIPVDLIHCKKSHAESIQTNYSKQRQFCDVLLCRILTNEIQCKCHVKKWIEQLVFLNIPFSLNFISFCI